MNRSEYINRLDEQKKLQRLMREDKYLLNFHLIPPSGWLNDPNGLCQIGGVNHIYYQYTPFDATWGMKLWGHYTTEDWVSYKEHEPFIFPDVEDDRDGVYSGSAFVKDGEIYFYYTGNVKHTDKKYDYILEGREQNTIMLKSLDGFNYDEKRTVLRNSDYPNMSCHVRDPQIIEKCGSYYMVLGARDINDRGCVIIYVSKDLESWSYHMRVDSQDKFGYMWECPNLIEIDGKMFLICCPQGVEKQGIDYANIYQCGYFPIKIDFERKEYKLGKFVELDRGFDIYAPQVFTDEKGRKILIAWMGLPDAEYNNEPTIKKGWQHALTLGRELKVKDGKIFQLPLEEYKKLRYEVKDISELENIELDYEFKSCKRIEIVLREEIKIKYDGEILTLDINECGYGRDKRSVAIKELKNLNILMDSSSIEIFVNHGEEVFTSRCYCKNLKTDLKCFGEYVLDRFKGYGLKKFEILR